MENLKESIKDIFGISSTIKMKIPQSKIDWESAILERLQNLGYQIERENSSARIFEIIGGSWEEIVSKFPTDTDDYFLYTRKAKISFDQVSSSDHHHAEFTCFVLEPSEEDPILHLGFDEGNRFFFS